MRRRYEENALHIETPLRIGQAQAREIQRRADEKLLDAAIGGRGFVELVPAFDRAFDGRQRTAGNDGGRDHHAAGQFAGKRQMRTPAQKRHLGDHAGGLGDAGEHDVAILRRHMRLQRSGRFTAPHLHRLGYHGERIDDLRIARHGIEVEIGAAEITGGFGKLPCGETLVQPGDDEQHRAADHDDDAEMRMDEIDHHDEERHQRCIEESDERSRRQEGAQLLQVLQDLVVLAVAMQGCAGGGRKDRRAKLHLKLDSGAHQDEATDGVHESLQQNRAKHGHRQHDKRVHRAAGQHPVGNLEQIKRDGEQQDIDGDGEQHHHHHVAANGSDALGKTCGEIDRLAALVETALASAAATSATSAAIVRRLLAATTRHWPAFVFADRTVIIVDGFDERQVCIVNLGLRLRWGGWLPVRLWCRSHRGNVPQLFGMSCFRKRFGWSLRGCWLGGGCNGFCRLFRAGQLAQIFDGFVDG